MTLATRLFEHFAPAGVTLNFAGESFDRAADAATIAFEGLVLFFALGMLAFLRGKQAGILKRFALMLAGVGAFEIFTMSMWNNHRLGSWAYLYRDVSWVLLVGWSALLLGVVCWVDRWKSGWRAEWRFLLAVGILALTAVPLEELLLRLGVRSYTPEVEAALWGRLPGLSVPSNIFYYVPVFCGLVLGFYRYWELVLERKPVLPFRKRMWARDFVVALAAVLMFEVMIEPMVENVGFPAWSYVYRDLSLALSLAWVLLIWLSLMVIDGFFVRYGPLERFFLYVTLIVCVAAPLEASWIHAGMRVYSPTTAASFSGLQAPLLNVPIEVAFGLWMYFALVVAFIRYWEVILDQRRPRVRIAREAAPELAPKME